MQRGAEILFFEGRHAHRGEKRKAVGVGRGPLPFRCLENCKENENSLTGGQRSSSKPINDSHLPTSQLKYLKTI